MEDYKHETPNEEIDLYIRHKDMEIEYGAGKTLIPLSGGRFISTEGDGSIYVFGINKGKYDRLSKTYADRLLIKDNSYRFEFLSLEENQLELEIIEFSEETSKLEVDLVEDREAIIKRERRALKQMRDATDPHSLHKKNLLFGNETPKKALKAACLFETNTLNSEQKDAIQYAVGVKDMYLIWGPPGTGKTHIIPEIVSNYGRLHKGNAISASQKILVCSYQNTAVDNVVRELFDKFRSDIVRFGPSTLGKKFKEVFFEEQVKKKRSQIESEYKENLEMYEEKIKRISKKIESKKGYMEDIRSNIEKLTKEKCRLQGRIQEIEARKVETIKNIELIDNLTKKYPANTALLILYKFRLGRKVIKITEVDGATFEYKLSQLDYDGIKSLHNRLINHKNHLDKTELNLDTELEDIIQKKETISRKLDDEAKNIDLRNTLNAELSRLENEKRKRIDNVVKDIISKKSIIATTNLKVNNKIFDEIHFDLVVMDESGAIHLPGAAIPILNGDKIVFLGDHKQLPPVVTAKHYEIKNFLKKNPQIRSSVFEKLYDENYDETISIMLKKQYRMRGEIADFVSRFYNRQLETPEKIECVLHENGDDILGSKYSFVCFLRKFGTHRQERGSLYSPGEIRLIKKIIENFEKEYGNEILDKITVITPYRAQNEKINEEMPDIDCGTVHKFQGQEKEIVIYGTTKYFPSQSYGFGPLLQQDNLLNVAISRAKEKVIIIGDERLFRDVEIYKALYDHMEKHGYIVKTQLSDYDGVNTCRACNKVIGPEKEYCYVCDILKKMQNMQSEIPREIKAEDTHLVRSVHEALIDNWLYKHDIKHEVEKKIPIKQLKYCDWYLPDYDLYIEYWGMMNDLLYKKGRKIKERLYEENGLKLLGLEDKDTENLDEIIRFKLEKFGVKIDNTTKIESKDTPAHKSKPPQ